MTMRRAAVAAIAVLFTFGAVGCASRESDDASPSQDLKARSETRSQTFPGEPKIDIEWQSTVVDVEPTSRFKPESGEPDLARVETKLALSEEPNDEQRAFFEGLDGVEVEYEGQLVRMRYAFEIQETDENRYEFEFSAPVEFAQLSKNDDVSVVVLLPREATKYEDAPNYEVRLEGFTEDTPEDDLEILQAKEAPGNRITIGLYERTDPKIGPIYIFNPL